MDGHVKYDPERGRTTTPRFEVSVQDIFFFREGLVATSNGSALNFSKVDFRVFLQFSFFFRFKRSKRYVCQQRID